MRTIFAAAACLALLAACSDSGADSDADSAIPAEEMAAEASSGEDVRMRAGQWEHTVEFTELDVAGVPEQVKGVLNQHSGQKMTTTSCLTPEEANRPSPDFFGGGEQENCTYEAFDRTGNRMVLNMTCQTGQGGTAEVAMNGEFDEESFTLTMNSRLTGTPGGAMTIKGTATGRRIGECPA